MDVDRTTAEIRAALVAHLAPARIFAMVVTEDADSDGDPILDVRVVYDPASPHPGEKMFSATSFVRQRLEAIGDRRFPLIAFVSRDDEHEAAA